MPRHTSRGQWLETRDASFTLHPMKLSIRLGIIPRWRERPATLRHSHRDTTRRPSESDLYEDFPMALRLAEVTITSFETSAQPSQGELDKLGYLRRGRDDESRHIIVRFTERRWSAIKSNIAVIRHLEADWQHRLGKQRSSRTYTGPSSRPRNYSVFSRGFFSAEAPNHPIAAGIAKSGRQATRKRVCIASKMPEDGTINSKATANG